ncbi:hypothetical protein F4819DRAFT_461750 [Hypoxylon fuscum]|nr:hypothetical protein F4819DRAFT_461750 [Hypoxylon fuscum]
MESRESRTPSCQLHGSSTSKHEAEYHWRTVDPVFPSPAQTIRLPASPNTELPGQHERPQGSLSYENYGSVPDMHPLCSTCHHQFGALDVNPFPQDTTLSSFEPTPTYFTPLDTEPQLDASEVPDCPPPPLFQGLELRPAPVGLATPPERPPSVPGSATESQTVSIPSSSTERAIYICSVVHSVHDVCLQSTKTYLESHLANRRARASNLSLPNGLDSYCSHSQPKTGDSGSSSKGSNGNSSNATLNDNNYSQGHSNTSSDPLCPIPAPTNSLLKNVSSICSMLWAGSQTNRLDVLNVERLAVDNMGRLLCWAEAVALGDYDEWRLADDEALWRVLEAGRNLCAWLGVPDGIQTMSVLESDWSGYTGL